RKRKRASVSALSAGLPVASSTSARFEILSWYAIGTRLSTSMSLRTTSNTHGRHPAPASLLVCSPITGSTSPTASAGNRKIALAANVDLIVVAAGVRLPNASIDFTVPDLVERLLVPVADRQHVLVVDAAHRRVAVVLQEHALERLRTMKALD